MNKKRVQEVSRKQKPLAKRLSAVVLHSKTDLMHPKSPGRPPSPPIEIGIQHGDAETCRNVPQTPKNSVPKTKFTSNDKSSEFRRTSSPRLKSFPAEELRRFDASPRVEVTLPPYQIYGQGDGLTTDQQQNLKIQRNQLSQPEVFNVVPLERSPERQHRPSVPRPDHQDRMPTEYQSEGNFARKREFGEEMDKQPVGGRNAVLFSQQMEEQSAKMFPEQHNQDYHYNQRSQTPNRVRFAETPQEIPPGFSREPPQVVQGIPQEIPQGMNPGNYYFPQQFIQQFAGLGMTSPQDVMINQSRMYQYGVLPHFHQQQHHQEQVGNASAHNQQICASNQVHNLHNQMDMIPQQENHEYPRQQSQDEHQPSKSLQFTPDMIKAQEKLLKTLHQQGFTDDTIKRQFEGLLDEQRRELEYLQQLEAFHNSADDDKVTMEPRRRRRITKMEEDGKPEWMMHITPPWVSLAELEERRARDENQKTANQEKSEDEKGQQQNGASQQQNVPQMMMSPFVYHQQQQQMMNPQLHEYQQQMRQNSHQMQHNGYHVAQGGYQIQNGHHAPQNYHQTGQYHMCNHQHHQQPHFNSQSQVAQQVAQQNNNQFFQHQNQVSNQQTFDSQNHENLVPQEQKPRLEPISLLKLKMYKDVIKRQKQNNGLQDIEVYKEAMVALKNPENRKGLEYLANLEKKQNQVKLNGIQEADEVLKQSWPHKPPDYVVQQKKTPRANGLENTWNSENPPTPRQFRSSNEAMPVYPKRIDDQRQHQGPVRGQGQGSNPQNYNPAFQNIDNQFQAQVYAQDQGGSSQGPGYALWRSNSLPFDMYSQNRQNCVEVPRGCFGGQGDTQGQISARHFEEPKVIGGVTYYGRKPEFMQNSRQYF